MLKLHAGILASFAITVAAVTPVSAAPIQIDATSLGGTAFSTSGGNGTVNNYIDFGHGLHPSNNGSGEMVVNITNFADAGQTGVGQSWQLFAVFNFTSSSQTGWQSAPGSSRFDHTAQQYSGTLSSSNFTVYAIQGDNCSFGDGPGTAGYTCGGHFDNHFHFIPNTPTVVATGSLLDASTISVYSDPLVSDLADTESFHLAVSLTSVDPTVLVTPNLTLDVFSGGVAGLQENIDVNDPIWDFYTSGEGLLGTFLPGQQPVNWDANAPVPAPNSLTLLGAALLGLAAMPRRRRSPR